VGIGRKKEKRSKKESNGRPVETGAADGNPPTSRIPTAAWKAQTAFHSSHKAQQQFHYTIHFERQRSTLNCLTFGPKNGEHFMETAGQSPLAVEESAGLGFLRIEFDLVFSSRFLFIEWNTRPLLFPLDELQYWMTSLVLEFRGLLQLTAL
jgi:hypothetical protein